MPAKVVCPSCHMSLNAPDDLLGQTVKCEECGSTFTARAPARPQRDADERNGPAKSRYRHRDLDDDDDDDSPRSRRGSRFDDERPRPRTRPRKTKGNNALPFILAGGGLAMFLVIGVAVVGYFAFRKASSAKTDTFEPQPANNFAPLPRQAPLPNNAPKVAVPPNANQPAAGVEKIRLSNPRWTFGGGLGGDFEVDYQFTNNQRPAGGMFNLKFKYPDGSSGSATLNIGPFDGASGTWKINVFGGGAVGRGRRGGVEIWVEEGFGRFANGTKISNTVTLN